MSNNSSSFNIPARKCAEDSLAAYLRGGRLFHAMLVEDPGGCSGLAGLIARAALCSGEGDKPCGVCRDCHKTEKGAHPDLIRYSGGEKTRSLHVDTVRQLRREAYIRPNEAERKVFILENAHNMTVQAQNALLKIIEEPPSGVLFILVCDNRAAMLETVFSRVRIFSDESPMPEGATESDLLREKAAATLDRLLFGSELEAMADFAPYERDRAGFSKYLAELRNQASQRIVAHPDANASRERREQLIWLVELIDETDRALGQNLGGLLATVSLSAKFKAGRDARPFA